MKVGEERGRGGGGEGEGGEHTVSINGHINHNTLDLVKLRLVHNTGFIPRPLALF